MRGGTAERLATCKSMKPLPKKEKRCEGHNNFSSIEKLLMKSIHISIILFLLGCTTAFAQSPAPEPDTLKDVKQTDPELKVPLRSTDKYKEDHQKIAVKQLPESILENLKTDKNYLGWENAKAYKNKTGSEYVVEITRLDTTRTFVFDKTGKRLKE